MGKVTIMHVKSYGCAISGVDAITITVEANMIKRKQQQQLIIGLPDNAVKESLPRVESAILNSNYRMPSDKIIFNLSPADIKKTGAAFDLAMAIALLAVSNQLPDSKEIERYVIMGELALDGSILPVKGALPVALQAWKDGFEGLIVPQFNSREAGMVNKISVFSVNNLKEVVDFFRNKDSLQPVVVNTREQFYETHIKFDVDYSDVKGQAFIKRGLEVAAAGGHNAILMGPPGSGKSMLAQRLPTILPPLTIQEALETTKIYSIAGRMMEHGGLLSKRPFRAPHHTISNVALVGGGSIPSPGEISLAHNGVLFLDELPEFSRAVLEVMRQPLEDRRVIISRAMRSLEFPANFMLLASMNLCPCGYRGHPDKECICSPFSVQKYLSKISGPLMDRIDLQIDVEPLPIHHLTRFESKESSCDIRERVVKARNIQTQRFIESPAIHTNASMTSKHITEFCQLDSECENLILSAMKKLKLSARAYDRILKVSRTIADLEGISNITVEHIAEAIQYRSLDKNGLLDKVDGGSKLSAKRI